MIEINKKSTISFTGHRELRHSYCLIEKILTDKLISYIESGYDTFLCGMAVGFDMLAGRVVLKLKEKYKDIKLVLCIPCVNQEKYFSYNDKQSYEFLKDNADDVIFVSQEYTNGCMLKRDRFMVDNSNLVIAYQLYFSGGTAYTTAYARNLQKQVDNIISCFERV